MTDPKPVMRQDSPQTTNQPFGAQINNYGFSERVLLIVLIVFIVLAFFAAGLALDRATDAAATARAEVQALRETVRTNNAKIEVLQYDHNALKQQLVAKGLYTATEH